MQSQPLGDVVPDIVRELAQTELFADVPLPILEFIKANVNPAELECGDILLSPEEENHYVYVLLAGSLAVHFGSLESPEMRVIEKGLSVGELSLIDQSRPSAYVVAKEHCRIIPIHRDLLQHLVSDINPVVRNLLRVLTRWIKANTECMVNNTSKIGELTNHASTDALTGLYNRRSLDNEISHILTEAIENSYTLCVLLIDVDHFKNYNDTLGHLAGDQILIFIGKCLKNTIRPNDTAYRYGGEEFLVLLPDTSFAESVLVAERIRKAIEKKPIITADCEMLPGVTVSIGIAANRIESTPISLIESADAKLYQAKQAGRNCVKF
jgi:diguanylate cyclase (GGDEF)-like protein